MTDPEEAIELARERAVRRRTQGPATEDVSTALDGSISGERPSLDVLTEWSVIEADAGAVYSTRRAGTPITAVKQLLLRLLRQYHAQLESRQTRFNIALLSHFRDLEERVARLEREAADPAREATDSGLGPDRPARH